METSNKIYVLRMRIFSLLVKFVSAIPVFTLLTFFKTSMHFTTLHKIHWNLSGLAIFTR